MIGLQNNLARHIVVMFTMVGMLALAGCNSEPATSSVTAIASLPLKATLTPSTSATLVATPLLLTHATTSAPTIASATPTVTSTPVPTLTDQQLKEYALAVLNDNGGCDLPCWWGIVPGEANFSEIKEKFGGAFVSLNGVRRSDGTMYHTAYFVSPPANFEGYHFTLGFIEHAQLIQAIEVRTDVDESVQSNPFAADWQRFSLDQILSHYGEPTHVELQVKPPLHLNSPPSYLMWIVYQNHGFWILYAGRSSYDGSVMRICPSLKMMFGLDLWLQSAKSQTPVFEPELGAGTASLEKATGMSLEEFYNTFKSADKGACLESMLTVP